MPRRRLWQLLRDPKNLAVLLALGSVLAFVWREIVAPRLNETKSVTASPQHINPDSGSSIGPTGTRQVSVLPAPEQVPAALATTPLSPDTTPQQIATASGSGVAINASGTAHVEIHSDRESKK